MGLFDRIKFITRSYINSFRKKRTDDQETYASASSDWDEEPVDTQPYVAQEVINAYKHLGVELHQSWKEIHTVFRKLMKDHHPDRYQDPVEKEKATKRTQVITENYEIIKNFHGQ